MSMSVINDYHISCTEIRENKQDACIPAIRDLAEQNWLAGRSRRLAVTGNRGIVFVGHVAWILMRLGT